MAAGAGTVGVPVNEGELIVAFKAKSESKEVILDVLLATVFVNDVILEVFEAIEFKAAVILEVLDAIDVGSVAIVAELTPPTELTVGNAAVPPKSFVN